MREQPKIPEEQLRACLQTSMTFTPSRLSFFPGDWITMPECIGW
jgi:hypothetical protein